VLFRSFISGKKYNGFYLFLWFSFVLSQKDMEMSYAARVLSVSNRELRSEYANSLINVAER